MVLNLLLQLQNLPERERRERERGERERGGGERKRERERERGGRETEREREREREIRLLLRGGPAPSTYLSKRRTFALSSSLVRSRSSMVLR